MKRLALIVFLAALAVFPKAGLTDDKADYQKLLQDNCAKELQSYCKGVQLGDARPLACLYARSDKLSGSCMNAVMASAERLKTAIVSLSDVQRLCAQDVANLCPDVVSGKGHIVECLTIAKGRVSGKCNGALDGAFLRP